MNMSGCVNYSVDITKGKYRVSDFVREIYSYICDSSQIYDDWRRLKQGIKYDTIEYISANNIGYWIACNHSFVIDDSFDFQSQVWKDFDLLAPNTAKAWEKILSRIKMMKMNKFYETDCSKGVYKLEDFCNALKDNNCIVDTKVFINWRDLVGSSTLYDSVRFVIFSKVDGLTYGQWIACNHDLVITDYAKQEWKDFYSLNENTSRIWERLLFQSAVKPVEKDYWNKIKFVNVKSLKQSFKIDEVLELIKKNLKSLNKSEDSLDMMQDILDLQSMKMLMKNNENIYFSGNLWCIEVESFGKINKWTLPKWIGELLNDEA